MSLPSLPREWLMLLHQLPADPPALRVRVWRRLQSLGSLQLKSTAYLLPFNEDTQEDFAWLAREISAAGAEATVWQSRMIFGPSEDEVIARFQKQSQAEYAALEDEVREAKKLHRGAPHAGVEGKRWSKRQRSRFQEIRQRDFFNAPGREVVGALLDQLVDTTYINASEGQMEISAKREEKAQYQGRTWVTRANVKVDRMASAWLISRFIDPEATFRFIQADEQVIEQDALRFDMYEGEFTHEGDLCTFETLVRRFHLEAPGLEYLSQIIHDIDLKDGRHGHAETASLSAALSGISASTETDLARIQIATEVFDRLLEQFSAN